MRSTGQLGMIGVFCALISANLACVIWTWPGFHVFGWFALIWLALACLSCVYLIVNKDRKRAVVALAVCTLAFLINCDYLAAITGQV